MFLLGTELWEPSLSWLLLEYFFLAVDVLKYDYLYTSDCLVSVAQCYLSVICFSYEDARKVNTQLKNQC